ncbi:DnaJ domain-containing protein [Marinobacter orientalis]|uniref:DnaJ domain-containing protein n=1 Tax=Marinobacter orientalis TaxID=1928859 RepID=A0A7Y0NJF4_9GAMM|nr:DnaJ domain-containing protein [Marinobacter orientalis]NMT62591.1 DnaJ domain-containing protein [Marinobacter orientalis]TGX51283.1 molecular chaperone DnaJ [Marinobacter orientalis]
MPLTFLVLILAVVAWFWLRSQPASQRKPAIIKLAVFSGILMVVVMALTGRLHFLFALLGFLFPLLRRFLPALLGGGISGGFGGGADGADARTGNQSHVASDILDMTLDHDSGNMTGEILKGPMAGRALADLGEGEFIELLQYCRQHDDDSARLLETYLDRRFGDSWRADDPHASDDSAGGESAGGESGESYRGGALSESEARDILGVEPDATRKDIIQAHRRMMQKMHPDRGGSNYFAARINEAKELLLGE